MTRRVATRPSDGSAATPAPWRAAPDGLPRGREGRRALRAIGWTLVWLGVVGAVGVADAFTPAAVSMILLYLAPIGFATWFVGLWSGMVLSFAGALIAGCAAAMEESERLGAAVLGWNGLMQLGASIALVLVLSALRNRLEAEESLARTDTLTKIPNRRAFFEVAQHELERARRNGRPLTLVYLDVDDFKDVNDRLGHAEGDALLVVVARTLRAGTRAMDSVARLGGDEFALLLPETNAEMAEALLDRVRAALLDGTADHGWNVRFSTGAAVFHAPAASVDEMMARADELMYAAKRSEKGSVRIATYHMPPRPFLASR